jgi:hypothetical protein
VGIRRVRAVLALLAAFVLIASGSTVANAAPDPLRGGGKAIVRIDAPKIDVKKVGQNQYRITLPASAKGQWLGTRQKTLMIGELTARDLVKGWSALGHKRDSKVATTIKWKPAGAKVQFIPAQISQAKRLADGRTMFEVTSVFPIPSQLTNASLNLARASGPDLRTYPKKVSYSFTSDIYISSTIQGNPGPANEALASTKTGTCYSVSLTGNGQTTSFKVSCNGASVSGTLKLTYSTSVTPGSVYLSGTLGVNGQTMNYSVVVANWYFESAPGGSCTGFDFSCIDQGSVSY